MLEGRANARPFSCASDASVLAIHPSPQLTTTILSGANTDTADTTTDILMPDGAMLRKMSFTLTAPSQTYVIKIVGTSTDIVDQFMIEHRYDTAQLA